MLNLSLEYGDGFVLFVLRNTKGIICKRFKVREEFVDFSSVLPLEKYADVEHDINEFTAEQCLAYFESTKDEGILAWGLTISIKGYQLNLIDLGESIVDYLKQYTNFDMSLPIRNLALLNLDELYDSLKVKVRQPSSVIKIINHRDSLNIKMFDLNLYRFVKRAID